MKKCLVVASGLRVRQAASDRAGTHRQLHLYSINGRHRNITGRYRDIIMNNSASRQTVQIGRKPAANVHHATRFAEALGYPLNQFVTINYTLTECPSEQATSAFRHLLASWFARWLRRHPRNVKAAQPTYVYTFEAAGGQVAVHWLVHIPRGLIREFWRKVPEWVEMTTGGMVSSGTVKHRRIQKIVGLKRYILKGMDPYFAKAWKIRPSPQGVVIGRRSGFSRNLGPTARQADSYRPKRFYAGSWDNTESRA